MRSPIRMEALETLDAIDRHGSFAAAATALHRVPSAITYSIQQLEENLGCAVFDRRGHRAILTPAGRLILEEGRHILSAAHALAAAARRADDDWEAELRIAIDTIMPTGVLWSAIDALGDIQPALHITVNEETLSGTLEALTENRADLALASSDLPVGPGIRQYPFTNLDTVFCCAPHHPLADEPEPVPDNVRRQYRAIPVADSARHMVAHGYGLLDGQPRLTVGHMASKVDALIHGLGVGYCARYWVADALANGRLVEKRLVAPHPPAQISLYWHHDARGRALHWLIDHLTDDKTSSANEGAP